MVLGESGHLLLILRDTSVLSGSSTDLGYNCYVYIRPFSTININTPSILKKVEMSLEVMSALS